MPHALKRCASLSVNGGIGASRPVRGALPGMKTFMDKDFLLETETAKHLFHDYAESMPLVDYHCHISPKEIYENRRFNDIVEVWLGGRQPGHRQLPLRHPGR